MRTAVDPHESDARSGTAGPPEQKRGWPEWVRVSIVPVAVAVMIAALSPLGDGLRELLFPTKAAISGTVTLRGAPLPDATLQLDGRPAEDPDQTGSFLISDVGNGDHRLEAQLGESYRGSMQFRVKRGEAERRLDPLELRADVRLGYAILSLKETGKKDVYSYELVFWIKGEQSVLRRVRQVSYQLPAPMPGEPAQMQGSQSQDPARARQRSGRRAAPCDLAARHRPESDHHLVAGGGRGAPADRVGQCPSRRRLRGRRRDPDGRLPVERRERYVLSGQ